MGIANFKIAEGFKDIMAGFSGICMIAQNSGI